IIKKVEWHYSYSSGNYEWEKEMTTIDSFSLKSNEAFSKTVGENGNYIIEIHDRLGGHSASSEFDVWWQEYSNLSPKDDLKSVEIHFEDRLYQKGDKLLATIKSPILKGELFVTLESDKVLYYERLSIDKGVAKVEIPIESDIKHGAYLHATAYRASDTSSALIPFRAMGYQYIKANRNAHKIDIKIDTPTHSKSKTTLKIGLSANKKSKVLVSIVDTGILQLARQEEPKIFEHFNQQPNKQLSYYDLYDQLLAYLTEGKLIDFGAGDIAIAKKQKHLPPDLGKRVKPFMLWSGIFELKDNNRSLGIDIPEFNGKATIIAIAINEDSLGVNSKELIVKDDIMIKPSYPKYTLAGDKIDVPIRIFNTTKTTKTITLSSKLSDNLSFDISESNMTIPANSSKLLNAKLTAKEVGKGEINIQASFGHEEVSKSVELPIYNPYAISTKTFKGISNKTETFTVPNAYKGAKVYLTLSDNLIGSMRDDLKYLIAYPYGCVEQTTSKLLAMHHANTFLANDTLVGESQNFIRQGIKKLRNMQNYYGEFSYWEEGGEVHPYASLYAAQTLLELKRDGVEIESSMIEKIIKMLKSVTTQNAQYLAQYSKFHRIYAAYILAEDHNLDASSANMLLEQKLYEKHFLSTYYLAAIFKMQGKEQKALELYNSMPNTLKSYTRNYGNLSGNFESNRRDMFLHFMVKSQYFKKEAKDLATVQQSLDELYSTQEKAMALKAISLYLGKPKKSKLDVTLDINGQSQKHTQAISMVVEKLKSDTITLTPKSATMSYNIELVKHLPKAMKNTLSSAQPLSIMREFIDEDTQKVSLSHLKQGDKIYAKVTVANMGKINDVVVNQRIPACLSVVNSNITERNEKFKNVNINQKYREIRDDRVLHFIDLAKKEKYDNIAQSHRVIPNQGLIFTPLIVTTEGECQLPAVISEAMYDSRISDYAKEADSIMVGDKSSKPTPTLESKAKTVVQNLYRKEMHSSNAHEFVNLFAYPLSNYYRTKNASKEDVLKDKEKYFKEWTKRVYSNMKLTTTTIDKKSKEVTIKIEFDYVISNSKKELTGVSRHLVTVKEIGGELLISKIKIP
ncbi:MAG: hypothetical protein K0U38_06700, partial [Epsilonproteobacteria bacterium]|nr:hypothetical protein [Campylobacterota bacterium]